MARRKGGWLARLFGLTKRTKSPFALDLPSHPAATRVQRPKWRGRTEQQQEADDRKFAADMRKKNRAISRENRRQARAIGATTYVWRAVGDLQTCESCRAKDGKRFSWNKPPPGGHPGEPDCCSMGWCRCVALTQTSPSR